MSPVAHVTSVERPVDRLGPIRCRRISRVCPTEQGPLEWSQAAGVATLLTHTSDILVILIMKVQLLQRPRACTWLWGSLQCQIILGCHLRQMRERGLLVGRVALVADYLCPQGAVWDIFKDALLSLIKYASLPVKL